MNCGFRAPASRRPARLEDFDWSAAITLGRLLDAVFSLEFLAKHEHVLLVGPAGVGKSFMAQALGFTAIRAGYTVRFVHSDDFFRAMAQARVDNSVDRTFRSFLAPDLLILDDLGLHRLTAQQSADLYELIINRHRASSFTTAAAAASGTALWGRPPPVAVGQCGSTVLAVSREKAFGMTFAHSHNLGCLGDGKLVFQNAVENLNPCLFLLIQRYIPHRDDIFADQLAGDEIVEHQQVNQGHQSS